MGLERYEIEALAAVQRAENKGGFLKRGTARSGWQRPYWMSRESANNVTAILAGIGIAAIIDSIYQISRKK